MSVSQRNLINKILSTLRDQYNNEDKIEYHIREKNKLTQKLELLKKQYETHEKQHILLSNQLKEMNCEDQKLTKEFFNAKQLMKNDKMEMNNITNEINNYIGAIKFKKQLIEVKMAKIKTMKTKELISKYHKFASNFQFTMQVKVLNPTINFYIKLCQNDTVSDIFAKIYNYIQKYIPADRDRQLNFIIYRGSPIYKSVTQGPDVPPIYTTAKDLFFNVSPLEPIYCVFAIASTEFN